MILHQQISGCAFPGSSCWATWGQAWPAELPASGLGDGSGLSSGTLIPLSQGARGTAVVMGPLLHPVRVTLQLGPLAKCLLYARQGQHLCLLGALHPTSQSGTWGSCPPLLATRMRCSLQVAHTAVSDLGPPGLGPGLCAGGGSASRVPCWCPHSTLRDPIRSQ